MIPTLNNAAEQWWLYIFHATWQAALVAAIALAVVLTFRRLPAPWRYALLLVALVKFAVPPIVPDKLARFGLFSWAGPTVARPVTPPLPLGEGRGEGPPARGNSLANTPTPLTETPSPLPSPEGSGGAIPQPATTSTAAEPESTFFSNLQSQISNLKSEISSLTWKSWLMLLHALGTAAILTWIALGFCKLAAIARRAEKLGPQASSPKSQALLSTFTSLHKRLGLKDEIDLLITPEHIPPVAYWLLRPKIMLPQSLVDSLPPDDLETILAHELVHHRRNDWAANWLQLLACAAWWFNPLAWLLNQTMRHTREECCDDALLADHLTTHAHYSRTLLSAAEQMRHARTFSTTLGFGEHPNPVAKRLKRILDANLYRAPKLSGAALVLTAILCIAILPGLRSEQKRPTPPETGVFGVVRVVDEVTGTPITGAVVTARFDKGQSTATTDTAGQARLRIASDTTIYLSLTAKAERYVSGRYYYQSERSEIPLPTEITFHLEPGTTIGGVVRTKEGQPVEGATVSVEFPGVAVREGIFHYQGAKEDLKTDANGVWRFDRAPRKLDQVTYRVSHPDFMSDEYSRSRTRPADQQLRAATAVFELEKGLELSGIVTAADGSPIEGATVALAPTYYVVNTYPRVSTDVDGRFLFRNLPARPTVITIWAKGHGPDLREIDFDAQTPPQLFKLGKSRKLEGMIVDESDNPVPKANVSLRSWRQRESLEWSATTNDEGVFTWDDAPLDEFSVTVRAEGFAYGNDKPIPADITTHQIAITRPLGITGTVVDKATSAPIRKFKLIEGSIHVTHKLILWDRLDPATFTDGKFDLRLRSDRGEDQHLVRVEADGYLPGVSKPFARSDYPVNLTFELTPAPNIEGVVVTREGRPAAAAQVSLSTATPNGTQIINGRIADRGPILSTLNTKADQQGRFSLPPQSEDHAIVIVHDEGWARTDAAKLAMDPRITLEPFARIEGAVQLAGESTTNQPIILYFNYMWNLRQRVPLISQQVLLSTDAQGRFSYDRVVPVTFGEVEFMLRPAVDFLRRSIDVPLEPGGLTVINIGGSGATVRGRIEPLDPGNIWGLFSLDQVGGPLSISRKVLPGHEVMLPNVPVGKYVYKHLVFTNRSVSHWALGQIDVRQGQDIVELGTIELNPAVEPEIGKLAPDFSMAGVDGQAIQLSALRGKFVLLSIFWPDMGDSDALRSQIKALHAKHGRDDRLAIVTLVNTSMDQYRYPETAEDRFPGLSAAINSEDFAVFMRYTPRSHGNAVFLIGPDGKVIAKDLHGEGIKRAVEDALGK